MGDIKIRAQTVVMVKPQDLKLDPKNRNKHPREQIDRLVKLIKYQGFRVPVVVSNQTGFVKSGEGRTIAARELKIAAIPVIYQDFDNADQEVAFGTSDNAIAKWAEIDFGGVNIDLGDLGPDFDIELLGLANFTIDVAEKDMPDLPTGDKSDLQQITFTLHNLEVDYVNQALEIARKMGPFVDKLNENKNGNALARVCEIFVTQNGNG